MSFLKTQKKRISVADIFEKYLKHDTSSRNKVSCRAVRSWYSNGSKVAVVACGGEWVYYGINTTSMRTYSYMNFHHRNHLCSCSHRTCEYDQRCPQIEHREPGYADFQSLASTRPQ